MEGKENYKNPRDNKNFQITDGTSKLLQTSPYDLLCKSKSHAQTETFAPQRRGSKIEEPSMIWDK
jgi:hypothetical protein